MKFFLIVCSFVCISSCTKQVPPAQIPTATSVSTSTGTAVTVAPPSWAYASQVLAQVTPAMLADNPAEYCPKWTPALAQAFWVAFVEAVSEAESGQNATMVYTENFDGSVTNAPARSIGYLQLSIDDQKNHPNAKACQATTEATLKDPATNVSCGVSIMADMLGTSHAPVRTVLGKYWSTIRGNKNPTDSNPKAGVVITLAQTVKNYLPACFQ